MKNALKAIVLIAVLSLVSTAFAADPTPRPTPIRKATGFDNSVAISTNGGPGDVTCDFAYTVSGGAESLNDTIGLCKLPKGATVTDWLINMPAQGTAFAMDVGLQQSSAEYASASTCGAAATQCSAADAATNGLVKGGVPSSTPLTAETYFMLKVTTAATTPNATSGTIRGWVRYHMHGNAF